LRFGIEHIADKVRADESRAAGDEDILHKSILLT
jgi:hypothetical protein